MSNIIIVGTSQGLLDKEYGHKIDSFNKVYRSVNSLFFLNSYQKHVGKKTSCVWTNRSSLKEIASASQCFYTTCNAFFKELLVLNDNFDFYKELNIYNTLSIDEPREYYDLHLQNINKINYEHCPSKKNIITSYITKKYTYQCCLDIGFYKNIDTKNKLFFRPTAGMLVIYFLSTVLNIPNICVTGFDFFKRRNFWQKKTTLGHIARGHMPYAEIAYYNKLIKEKKIYELE